MESKEDNIEISPEFYQLLKQYTNSDDPLEDPNFDVAAYLNEKFPDFKSLDKLPNLIQDYEMQINSLDEEIDTLMCERAMYNEEMKNYMVELNNDVSKIIELVNNIKQSTDTNETTVKMICNDIKNLDNARNNITTTISSLTKLIMLITGIEKLESFVNEKQYKEAANAIAACNDTIDYFKEYRHITQVNTLYQKKDRLCASLLGTILDEFKKTIELLPNNSERLYEACLAINAIGDNAIKSLKTWFTQYKLNPYENIFNPNAKTAVEFSETERRFEWIKRCLKEYDKLYSDVFPPSWGFKSQICQEFCRMTKLHLNDILMLNAEGIKKIEVEILVKVLNATINFEKNLHEYLIMDYPGKIETEPIKIDSKGEYEENSIDEIKAKYTSEKANRNPNRKDPNESPLFQPFRVLGVISESFEPFMASYVTNEENKIRQIITGLKSNDRIEGKLYVSSLYLFNNIKQAMKRCLTFSKGATFNDLCNKFKDIFRYYNDSLLKSKINIGLANPINNIPVKLKDEEIKTICYVINTSDYCISTIGALTQSIKDKIEEKYEEGINYDNIMDNFRELYKTAYDILSNNIKSIISEILTKDFLKQNWQLESVNVTSESPFKVGILNAIEKYFTLIKDILQEEFLCHFLNIIPKIMTESMLTFLYKLKKIDQTGAEKLLLDIYELKEQIKKTYNFVVKPLPGQNKDNDSRYTCLNMIIGKEFGKIECRLKCLGSHIKEIGNAYKSFVDNKSKEDFDKLISLRGLRKGDITDYDKIFS